MKPNLRNNPIEQAEEIIRRKRKSEGKTGRLRLDFDLYIEEESGTQAQAIEDGNKLRDDIRLMSAYQGYTSMTAYIRHLVRRGLQQDYEEMAQNHRVPLGLKCLGKKKIEP